MANGKSDARSCSLRMDADIFERLEQYCSRTGASKTKVIEIALTAFLNNDDREQQILKGAGILSAQASVISDTVLTR